ncbi:MAG: fimbrillin family protein [Bacteroidales bacterium]|nr:fimbrillin family protein [Bacteroidales bacterium]
MKKTLLTMAAALALVGCSKSELVETPIQEQNAIAFGTYLGDNAQTRASVVTTETLGVDGFGVNAYYTGQNNYAAGAELNFMQNTKVTYNKDNQKWEYSPVKYWPNNSGDKVSFFAYGPYAKNAGDNNITQNGTSLGFVVPAEVKNQVDLIYNTNYNGTIDQTKPSVEELIHFQFGHALSRISLTVEAAVDEVTNGNNLLDGNTRINVKKVALVSNTDTDPLKPTGPFYTNGTLSLLNPGTADDGTPNSPWSNLTGSQGFVFNATDHFYHTVKDVGAENMTDDKIDVVQLTRFNASEPQRLLNDDSYLMVIPQEDAEFKIYIEYDVISGGYENNGTGTYDESAITNKITSSEALKVTFEQGKAYNFNLVLGMTSVKVDAEVAEWGDEIDGGEVWLPGDEDDVDELTATSLVYNANHEIVINSAKNLAEVRDLINNREIYKVNYQETDDTGNYYKVYKVNVKGEPDEEYKSFHEAYLMQVDDIDLGAYDNWVPIGSSYETSFNGHYKVDTNGDHHFSISNLKITSASVYAGLFGYTTGNIENVKMESVNIGTEDAPLDADYAAAIAGHASGTLTSCSVTSGQIYGKQVAGLVAAGNNAFFTDCSNTATVVSGSGDAAGIYAGDGGLIESCVNTCAVTSTGGKAAGITICTPEITDAKNSGNISGYEYAGGIAAYQNNNGSKIVASYNTANVTCSNGYAGGIVGYTYGESFEACYNTANTISGKFAGGIIGYWCIKGNETPLDAKLTSCYSTTANITATTDGKAGALCGEVNVETTEGRNSVTYTTCYYSDFMGSAIGNNENAEGITFIDDSEGKTWTEATTAMNNNISDWLYSSADGAAPTLSAAE